MRVLAFLLAMMGVQAVERLRLADGPHGCAGRLEVWHGGRWGTVCDDGWDLRDASVVCRALGCGGALAAPGGAFFGEGAGPVWLSELACRGGESQLGLCPHRGWRAHICSHEEDAGAVCSDQRAAGSRDGPESPSLLDQEPWLVLAPLNPSSQEPPRRPLPTTTQDPRLAGTPQNGPRKKSPRPPKQAKSTRAPVLTAGAPRQERLRLASGPHGCAGRLEVWHGGRWGTVCDDAWDLRDAAVACRELGCGAALAAPGGARFGPGVGPVWMDDVGCGGGEQALRDCARSPWGRSNCDHSEDAGLVCAGPAPRLRLVSGPHGCAGRLEVWQDGRWGTVCDDAWDLRDAAVACRELGCGGALAAPGGAFFGEGAGPILLDDLRCQGNETGLRFCPARPWGQHDCHHREDAGAVCDGMPLGHVPPTAPLLDSNSSVPSTPIPPVSRVPGTAGLSVLPASSTALWEPGPEAGSPQLRLVAGPSRCSGRLEVWHGGRWGTVCDDAWDLRDAAVVCRELGCGPPRPPDPTAGRFGWGAGPIWLDDVGCSGTEASLSTCPAAPWGKHNCAHNEDVGVSCTGTPGLDSVADPFSWSWIPGLGRDSDAWIPGELTTKPSARLPPSAPQKTTPKAAGKAHKNAKKWGARTTKRPTTQSPELPTITPTRGPGTQRTPEPRDRTPTTPPVGASDRLTSPLTATRTPQAPREHAAKTVAMPITQDPPEVDSGVTRQTPLSSGELWAGASPASPTEAGSGRFQIRLADGPNRCAGRLEVWHAGRWGTVCDDSWDLRDSTVVCWELGCGRVRPRVGKTHYGPGTGPIWLDDVGCQGGEASLSHCPARAWGQHNCDHEEDVGLTCTGHSDAEDYPPLTWDPISGEDLSKGTTPVVAGPGRPPSRDSTGSPRVPSPAARRHPGSDDEDGDGSFRTWDKAPRGDMAKGTMVPGRGGPTATTSITRSPGHSSPALRAHGNTDSARRPELRLLRPTTTRTPPPASSTLPGPPRSPSTSDSEPEHIPEDPASTRTATSDPPATWFPRGDPASGKASNPTRVTPGHATPTPVSTVVPEWTTEPPSTLPPPWSDEPLTSDPSEPKVVTPTSEVTPESRTALGEDTASYSRMVSEAFPTPDPTSSLHPTETPHPTQTPHPTETPRPVTAPHLPTVAETHVPVYHGPTSTPVPVTNSPLTSLETDLPTPAPTLRPSLHPQLTSMGNPHPSTSPMSSLESSPTPGTDPTSTEDSKPPGGLRPELNPPPTQTLDSASDSTVTPDPHLPSSAHPLEQPHLAEEPMSHGDMGSLGPCVAPVPSVRVMACEPPALVELVSAVRDMGGQLHRLMQALEREQQERQALRLGLSQLAEAAQGLGQLGEAVRRLAEAAWPPSTPVPTTTTTPEEEEERPLRGDV